MDVMGGYSLRFDIWDLSPLVLVRLRTKLDE